MNGMGDALERAGLVARGERGQVGTEYLAQLRQDYWMTRCSRCSTPVPRHLVHCARHRAQS